MSFEQETVVLLGYLYVLVEGLGILAAVHAVMKVRTAQGALAWAIALVFMPLLTLFPYLVFGRNGFDSYVRSRRAADEAMQTALVARDWRPWLEKAKTAELAGAAERVKALTRLARMPC